MIDFDINKVTFEERVIISAEGHKLFNDVSEKEIEHSITTLYFTAPKEWTKCTEDNHYSSCIMVEYISNHPTANHATVMISPTIKDDDCYTDVDWNSLDISNDEIQSLIDKAFEVIQKS